MTIPYIRILVQHLLQRTTRRAQVLIGIAGPPGLDKSTMAGGLVRAFEELAPTGCCTIVPLDGLLRPVLSLPDCRGPAFDYVAEGPERRTVSLTTVAQGALRGHDASGKHRIKPERHGAC